MATWPKWTTVRAEQARTALVDEDDWGSWVEGGECCRGIPGVFGAKESGHAADPPFFFHCLSCIAVVHRGIKIPSPNHARDHGLCLKCGQPAELDRNALRVPAAAAQQAEARGITVARLSTRKFCASCDPYSRPYCRARLCPNKGQRHRAYAGCTRLTRHNFPHCTAACARQKAVDKSTDAARSRKGKPPLDAVELSSDALSPLDAVEPSSDALSPLDAVEPSSDALSPLDAVEPSSDALSPLDAVEPSSDALLPLDAVELSSDALLPLDAVELSSDALLPLDAVEPSSDALSPLDAVELSSDALSPLDAVELSSDALSPLDAVEPSSDALSPLDAVEPSSRVNHICRFGVN